MTHIDSKLTHQRLRADKTMTHIQIELALASLGWKISCNSKCTYTDDSY